MPESSFREVAWAILPRRGTELIPWSGKEHDQTRHSRRNGLPALLSMLVPGHGERAESILNVSPFQDDR